MILLGCSDMLLTAHAVRCRCCLTLFVERAPCSSPPPPPHARRRLTWPLLRTFALLPFAEDILQMVHPGALLVYVGKQRSFHTRTQVSLKRCKWKTVQR